jgi:hypothetical protein
LTEVFVLLGNSSGTSFSIDEPIGIAVKTETEAKKYVERGGICYSHSYVKVQVFDSLEEGKRSLFRGKQPP